MGGFPKDYEIHVSGLIKLWAAEGFLKCRNGYKSLEDEAEEYLEELVKRGLVLVTSRKTNGKIKCCRLHELVRGVCIRKAQAEKFFLHVMGGNSFPPESIRKERRVSISHSQHLNYLGPNINTVISFQDEDLDFSTSLVMVKNFRLLRVLDLVNDVNPLPSQIFELIHLRYLALRNFIEIPAAISKLQNLQTLVIHPRSRSRARFCMPFYSSLPSEIWRMPQLRHLVFFHFFELPNPADGSALPLTNLQTLSAVANLLCGEKILEMIQNLKKLGIIYNQDNREYHLYNLLDLNQLEKLKITVYPGFAWEGENRLRFPSTLRKLTLVGGRFPMDDMAVIGSLPNLEVLKLIRVACDRTTWETFDGEFPQLKYLLIEESNLQHWISEGSHFPILKCLVLHQCLHLREIPEGIGEIPTLELIEVDDQNLSLVVSARQIQKNQQDCGNDALQVRCIRHQEIYDPLKQLRVSMLAVKRSLVPR